MQSFQTPAPRSHTAAPWYQTDDLTVRDSDGWIIASIRNRCEATEANARLIAAAPDLLAASVDLLEILRGLPKGPQHHAMIALCAAIEKATNHPA